MQRPPPERAERLRLLRILLIGATLLGLLTAAQHFAVMQVTAETPEWRTVGHALSRDLPFWYLWVLAAPVVVLAVRRVPLARDHLAGAIAIHLILAAGMILIHALPLLLAHRALGYPTPEGSLYAAYMQNILYRLTNGLFGYAILFGAVVAWDYHARLRQRELLASELSRQLAEARLQALRMQLNPHFLFNTLNTIAMLARQGDSTRAVGMLAGLSDLLRYVLEEAPPQEVRLAQELAFVERYLDIERARFPDRLRAVIDADPETRDALVPNLVLQPLVENAIRHGVARSAAAGAVDVVARRKGSLLELTVQDDGPGFQSGNGADRVTPATGIPVSSGGIGLSNTAARLAQLYGDRARLVLESRPGGGAVARVVLPFRPGPAL